MILLNSLVVNCQSIMGLVCSSSPLTGLYLSSCFKQISDYTGMRTASAGRFSVAVVQQFHLQCSLILTVSLYTCRRINKKSWNAYCNLE